MADNAAEKSTGKGGLFGFFAPKNEVAKIADVAAGEDENTKIADTAKKVQEAAQQAPTEARTAAAPQVADAAPTGISPLACFYLSDARDPPPPPPLPNFHPQTQEKG